MNRNEINARAKFGNNIVQVTSTNVQEAERQAESYAQKAEQSRIECANYLATIQNILAMCNTIKDNLETLIFDGLDEHKEDFDNPHRVSAEQINSYTKSETDTLLSGKQPVGNYLTEHQSLSNYYTKTESDNKYLTSHQDISGKANSADLSTVATTGDYDDLLNKPSIPSAQVQSDWSQADNTAVDYIKNKPTIPSAQIQSDWSQSDTNATDYIKNKPTIPDAQVQANWTQSNSNSADYIKNKPNIGNGTITIYQGGNYKGSFSVNQLSGTTINLDSGGQQISVDGYLDPNSANPVENAVITNTINSIEGALSDKQGVLTAGSGITISSGIDYNNPDFLQINQNTTQWHDITFASGKYFAVGEFDSVATSTDGISWHTVHEDMTTMGQAPLISVAVNDTNGMFVAVNEDGYFVSSSDMQNWNKSIVGNDAHWHKIIYENNIFLAVGDGFDGMNAYGYVAIGDGINPWSVSTAITGSQLKDVIYDGSQYVAVGDNSEVGYSQDGVNWTWSTFDSNPVNARNITYGDGKYCIIENGNVYETNNLINWSRHQEQMFQNIEIKDGIYINGNYVYVGYDFSQGQTCLYTSDNLGSGTWNSTVINIPNNGQAYCTSYCDGNLILGCEWGWIALYSAGSSGATISSTNAKKFEWLFEVTDPLRMATWEEDPLTRGVSCSLAWLDSAIKETEKYNNGIEFYDYPYSRVVMEQTGGISANGSSYQLILKDGTLINTSFDFSSGEYIDYMPAGISGSPDAFLGTFQQQSQYSIARLLRSYDPNTDDYVVRDVEIYKGIGKL